MVFPPFETSIEEKHKTAKDEGTGVDSQVEGMLSPVPSEKGIHIQIKKAGSYQPFVVILNTA